MVQRIAVVGGTPTWQRGIEATLADLGYSSVGLARLDAWRPGRGGRAVIVFVSDDEALDALVDFTSEYPLIPAVAVLPKMELSSFATVVRAGARGAVDDADSIDVLRHVLSAAIGDRVSIPLNVARAMAQRIPPPREIGATVDESEAGWLRASAGGETVAGLASQIGYSERETYRILGELYQRLGVTNRTEAIIWATRHGVLDHA